MAGRLSYCLSHFMGSASFSEELALFYNHLEKDLVCLSSAEVRNRALRLELTERILIFFAELKGV